MTYNLDSGGRSRLKEIVSVLAHAAPDVAALTEADDPQVVETLAGRLEMHHVWERGSGDRHIALLSRFPVLYSRIYNRPPLTQAVLVAALQLPTPNSQYQRNASQSPPARAAQPGRAISSLPSSIASPRSAFRIPHSAFTIYAVHFLPYLLLPFEIRRWQAIGELLRIIRRDQPGPHLILGDANAIAPGDRVLQRNNPARMRRVMMLQARLIFRLAIPRLLKAGYTDCFRATHPLCRRAVGRGSPASGGLRTGPGGGADGFTWMTGKPTTRYDYIFADPTLAPRLRDCRVVDDHPAILTASDHYPLLATFEL